jgi:putative iron-dependent peroxidase
MKTAQNGIFALGTSSHAYLEFDLLAGNTGRELVAAITSFREPRTTGSGVNLVVGFRPELWRKLAPDDTPAAIAGFNHDLVGIEEFTMPATQHDAILWIAGGAYDVVFDITRDAVAALQSVARIADETASWPYRHNQDLTGFIDGTENPNLAEAPEVALIPEGQPGACGSILLLQKWPHDAAKWDAVPVEQQELVIGRRKADSVELEDKPATSHAASTDQDTFGKVLRRNMPYGTVSNHGTMFVGFSADQARLANMLKSMAGLVSGKRDALTYYTRPVSGSYYFVPAIESLAPPDED